MMRSKRIQKRIFLIVGIAGILVMLLLKVFSDNISLFLKPAEVYQQEILPTENVRVGGYVKDFGFDIKSESYSFVLTDNNSHDVLVTYEGMLPSLFREGQMSVVGGQITKCGEMFCLKASEVLAKHDENYKPK
jgi:cytochrome c-type biogenesis protein CcmE